MDKLLTRIILVYLLKKYRSISVNSSLSSLKFSEKDLVKLIQYLEDIFSINIPDENISLESIEKFNIKQLIMSLQKEIISLIR